jgi:putative membrane protein
MSRADRRGRLDPMNIHEITPTATTLIADAADRYGPGVFHPWFLIFPITFWTLVIVGIVLVVRRRAGRRGEDTLRDTYAKGEIAETEYRQRLAVLRQTRR